MDNILEGGQATGAGTANAMRLQSYLSKIANSVNCGLYYDLTEQELIERLKKIQSLTVEALNK